MRRFLVILILPLELELEFPRFDGHNLTMRGECPYAENEEPVEEFIAQEEARDRKPVKGSDLNQALSLIIR